MTTLCIIDMQPFFSLRKKVIENVLYEIKLAKRRKAGIIVVEYKGGGDTHDDILSMLKDYDEKERVIKNDWDGSTGIIRACKKNKFDTTKMRFCGVYRSACVYATVYGMKRKLQKPTPIEIEIAINATGCTYNSKNDMLRGRQCLRKLGRFVNCKRPY